MNSIERRSVRGGSAVEHLLLAACQAFQLRDVDVLRGPSRVHAVAQARCYVASVLRAAGFGFSTPEIGKVLGGKHHATVFYYIKTHPLNLQDEDCSRRVVEAEAIRERLGRERDERSISTTASEGDRR
jgi:chromosomal replication initiation ATPase DnaA